MNKKMKRVALFSAFSSKVNANELVVVDSITAESYSTKAMAAMVNAVSGAKKTLIVLPAVDEKVVKSCANIPGVKTTVYNAINVYDILNCDKLVLAKGAAEKIQEVYVK
jgi:large subunit ribosomal protein L4